MRSKMEIPATPNLISPFRKEPETTEKKKHIQISMHSVTQMIGKDSSPDLFSEQGNRVENFAKNFGLELTNKIDKVGINLSNTAMQVLEGILRGFTETNYKGNLPAKPKDVIIKEKYKYKQPEAYTGIDEIPTLRTSQRNLIRLSGFRDNKSTTERVREALKSLGTKQYCFIYTRLARDKQGKPIKDKDGHYKKEEIFTVDTLFTIKELRDESTKELKGYEITPSIIFLDQIDTHFLLIPFDWREEINKKLGKGKKASSYLYRFIYFLRYQFEMKRRQNYKNFKIKYRWEAIAKQIKMPETVYIRNRNKAYRILENLYSSAKALGYLKDYIREPSADILILDESKYPTSEGNTE